MDSDQVSTSDDEFEFLETDEEISFSHEEFDDKSNIRCFEYSDEEMDVENQNIRIIDIKCEAVDEPPEYSESSEWMYCNETEELPTRFEFIPGEQPPGPQISPDIQEPVDFFKLFFTDELIHVIVRETNIYARKKLEGKTLSSNSMWKSWRDVTEEEFWAFIAIVLNSGTMPVANIQEYWSRSKVSYIPFYSETFTRNRFSQIFWMLHLKTATTEESKPGTRLQLVNCFLDYINSKFLDYFVPGKQICVAESFFKHKGQISFVSYNPKKPTRQGIRVYSLIDANTGYFCCILPYYGAFTTEQLVRPDLPVSTRIPLHLYQMLLDKLPGAQGHTLFSDRYYTSCLLAEELNNMHCHLTGMIQPDAKDLPAEINQPNFINKSTIAYRKGNVLVLAWNDKQVVTCLSTLGNPRMSLEKRILRNGVEVTINKPNIIMNYMKYMGGVDLANRYTSTYCFLKKALKWWRKLFFLGLEMCSINSYILYKLAKKQRNERPLSHLRFVKGLVEQLRGDFRQVRDRVSSFSPADVRLNKKLHIIRKGVKKDCKVCSERSKPGGRRETTYFCDTCPDKPRMHIGECFVKFHTLINYRA